MTKPLDTLMNFCEIPYAIDVLARLGFVAAVERMHGDSTHAKEYAMAVLMIEAHAALWTPEAGND